MHIYNETIKVNLDNINSSRWRDFADTIPLTENTDINAFLIIGSHRIRLIHLLDAMQDLLQEKIYGKRTNKIVKWRYNTTYRMNFIENENNLILLGKNRIGYLLTD